MIMPTINIDDKEYDVDDLSENAKNQLNSIMVTDRKIKELQADLAIAQTARVSYARALNRELSGK